MTKWFHSLIAALLAVMVLSSVGFAAAEAAPEYGGPFDPFPETITIRVMREFNSGIWFPEGEDVSNNIINDFYKEKLNIVYDVAWEVESGTLEQQTNLAIASGDLPDFFYADSNQVARLKEAGMIQPLTQVWNDYASENAISELTRNDMLQFAPVTYDGEIYGLPIPEDASMFLPVIYVRQDWLDKLGMSDYEFKTIEDIEKLARIFMEADMDGDGVANTVGIVIDNELDMALSAIGHPSGQYTNQFVVTEDNTLIHADIQDGMKDVLAIFHRWYEEGLLDPEFVVKDRVKSYETIASGLGGLYLHSPAYIRTPTQQSWSNDHNAEWVSYPIPAREDGTYAVASIAYTDQWLVVNADFEYPAAAVKQQNLWYELWQGEYATWFHGLAENEYNQAGEDFKLYCPFWWDPPYKNLNESDEFVEAWDAQSTEMLVRPETIKQYNRSYDFYVNGNPTQLTGYSNMPKFYHGLQTVQIYDMDKIVWDAYTGPITDSIAETKPMSDACRDEWFIKFIVGTADLDTQWEDYVNEWKAVGGEDLLTIVNEWYAAQ